MQNLLKKNISNLLGWHTSRKIIVFESDDWGSIRMPSKKACEDLKKKGIRVDDSSGWFLDALENETDLLNLFEVIAGFKDLHGNAPIFTFNTVMANPNFQKIKDSGFQRYYYEHFFESYKRYYQKSFNRIWDEGMQKKLIRPQFHAREHLNVPLWMNDLQHGFRETCMAFDYGFFGLTTETSSKNQKHYLAAYRAEDLNQLNMIKKITEEGLQLFEETFGFKSKTFIACNYIWPKELEPTLQKYEIELIQSQRGRVSVDPMDGGKVRIKRQYTGKQVNGNQIYTVRNVKFEPSENLHKNWVESALKEIENAFFWYKPAIISTHRINYVGSIEPTNRDRNLTMLKGLLTKILQKWPNVEFMSSDMLLDAMKQRD